MAEAIHASRVQAGDFTDQQLSVLMPSVEIYRPTEAEMAAFRQVTQAPMRESIGRSFGPEGDALLTDFLAAIDTVRQARPDAVKKPIP